MQSETEWLLVEIMTGLQKLACLSLDRTPAAEVLPGTAQAWHEALTDGREWDEQRDTQRVEAAFRTLLRTCRRWPSPSEMLDALPSAPPPPAIGYESKSASPEAIACARAAIEVMGLEAVQKVPAARPERETTPEQRQRIEAELAQHYGRKRAAGGEA